MTRITFTLRKRNARGRDWMPTEDAEVARLRKSGLSAREIAKHIENRTLSAVESRLGALRQKGAI